MRECEVHKGERDRVQRLNRVTARETDRQTENSEPLPSGELALLSVLITSLSLGVEWA